MNCDGYEDLICLFRRHRTGFQCNQSKDIYIRFAPTSAGWKTAILLIDGNPPCNDVSVSLMGTGQTPASLSVTPSGHILSAAAGSVTFSVSNKGGGTLNWTAEADPDDAWINITSGGSVSNNGTILVNYEANDGDARIGTVAVTATSAANSPQTVELIQSESRPSWALQASDHSLDDYFGQAVSISAVHAIVGADGDDDSATSSGAAYIYTKPSNGWADTTETAKVTILNAVGSSKKIGWHIRQ